jgi:hypothetical protein
MARVHHSAQPKFNNEQWPALIALHRTLLHEHRDFFLASQHPSASPALWQTTCKQVRYANKHVGYGTHTGFATTRSFPLLGLRMIIFRGQKKTIMDHSQRSLLFGVYCGLKAIFPRVSFQMRKLTKSRGTMSYLKEWRKEGESSVRLLSWEAFLSSRNRTEDRATKRLLTYSSRPLKDIPSDQTCSSSDSTQQNP